MKLKLVIRLAGAAALVAALASATAQARRETPPRIVAKQAQAARILAEISAIDERLNTISEQFDGARVRLAALRQNLRTEKASLTAAVKQNRYQQQRVAKLLVWLYTNDRGSALDVILGAHTLSQMLTLSDAEDAISKQSEAVAARAEEAKHQLELSVSSLQVDRAAAQQTVDELARQRASIKRGLAERTRLLASVQAQVAHLEAQERARQARLAAAARARLAAEAAARAKAEAEAAAKAKADAAAAAAAAAAKAKALAAAQAQLAAAPPATTTSATPLAETTTPSTVTTAPETTTTTTTTWSDAAVDTTTTDATTTEATTTTATTTTEPTTSTADPTTTEPALASTDLAGGHPDAATIALQYLGVPYVWGGSSPSGFDCSGLVTYVFAQLGIDLPHFAAAQWTEGVPVSEAELQPGDLVFFDALDHVGIYIGDNEFVAAPHTGSYVRIDSLGEPWYASHYVGARRI